MANHVAHKLAGDDLCDCGEVVRVPAGKEVSKERTGGSRRDRRRLEDSSRMRHHHVDPCRIPPTGATADATSKSVDVPTLVRRWTALERVTASERQAPGRGLGYSAGERLDLSSSLE